MTTIYNYYDKTRSRPVIENVALALAEHKRCKRPAAVEVVVNAKYVDLVAKAVGDQVPVVGNRGCLGPEVWVTVAEKSPDNEAGA